MVPVAPEVGLGDGHHDEVAHALRDLLVAAGAEVRLGRLKGVDPPDLDLRLVYLGIRAHSRRPIVTAKAAATRT